jgi:hypothetical protein
MRLRDGHAILMLVLQLCVPGSARADVYQEPQAFIAEIFGSTASPRVLWLTGEMQAEATAILGHPPKQLRQRFWGDAKRTVWILEEIGKEELITAAFVVVEGRIDHVRVLAYRESRGQEVRQKAFLRQFERARLAGGGRLDRDIDGIAGATLSVGAMERMARLALYFDARSRK